MDKLVQHDSSDPQRLEESLLVDSTVSAVNSISLAPSWDLDYSGCYRKSSQSHMADGLAERYDSDRAISSQCLNDALHRLVGYGDEDND